MTTFETTVSQVRAEVQLIQNQIAIEEPFQIICRYLDSGKWISQTIGILMRTPGDDERLCLGYMYSEGIIRSAQDIDKIDSHPRYTDEDIVRTTMCHSQRIIGGTKVGWIGKPYQGAVVGYAGINR